LTGPLEDERFELFAQEYLTDLNAVQAAIRAGFAKSTAKKKAYQLVGNETVQARIAELKALRIERIVVTQDSIVEELARVGFSNIADMCSFTGRELVINDLSELTPAQRSAIAEIECQPGTPEFPGKIKIKLHPKIAALNTLAEHLGMFNKDKDKTGGVVFNMSFDLSGS
jgi:phage terminase small subunit